MARTHMDAISVVLGLNRKKCVIVNLDGRSVARRPGGNRQPVRVGTGDRRSEFICRSIFRHPRGAAHATPARHTALLCQQERRSDGSGIVALRAALPAAPAALAGSFRLHADQLG